MKSRNIARYIILTILGAVMFAAGLVMAVRYPEAAGILKTLPYIYVGIGAGVFGGNLGTAIRLRLLKNNEPAARQAEIEEKDERNNAIRSLAKAKAYDLMLFVFGALLMSFALMQVDLYVILAFVAAYLFVVGVHVYYIIKLNKEM